MRRTPIFLDIDGDRYFALPNAAAAMFMKLIDHQPLTPNERDALADHLAGDLDRILDGLVEPTTIIPPMSSLPIDDDKRSWAATAAALASIAITRWHLRMFGLRKSLQRLLTARQHASDASPTVLSRIAGAHCGASRWSSAYADCLTRAIALSSALSRHEVAHDLILGVRTNPFAAHSWVQVDDHVVNDRPERVRPFTPILVL